MSHVVKCRLCKKTFDTDKLNQDDWIMPSAKYYYHTQCYEDWKVNKNNVKVTGRDTDFWYASLIDYLYRDIKMEVDFQKVASQWKNFNVPSKKMTPKGIYFAVRYYYDVLKGSIGKAQGGIGIVPNIYQEAAEYWTNLEIKKSGTIEQIIQQIEQRENRPVQQIIQRQTAPKKKIKWGLDDIEECGL